MQEELLQFKLQQVWTLVDLPNGKRAIGTKWVYRNKKDERGIVIKNKARLVTQGYTQEEGINYVEVFAHVARIEAIRLFLAYASFKDFVVYQMDVKGAFLYGKIEKEVYVCQPPRFENPNFPNRVYKRGKIEKTLFIIRDKGDILLVQFQMSSMGELTFFLGLDVKTASTPMETHKTLLKDTDGEDVDEHLYRSMIGSLMYLTSSRPDIMFAVCQPKLGLWYPKDSPFDLVAYTDSDYAGASLDRKSTTRGCQFLGCRLISWQCKKQTVVANSTAEAEYIAASNCCGQEFWIQNQLLDYGYNFMQSEIHIDNESTICIVKNPVFHSKTNHIEIRHHFIRDSNKNKLIKMIKIHTDQNVADLLIKAFDVSRFEYLIAINAARHNLLLLMQVNAVRHNLLLPVQVNAVEGDFIYTLIQGFIQSLTQFQSLIYSLITNPNSILLLIAALKFAETHNLVVFLEKPEESDGFAQIVDFLNVHPINYALTVNPTIYTSCIKQLWDIDVPLLFLTKNSTFLMFLDKQVEGMSKHKEIYVTPSHTKKFFANMKRQGKDFSGRDTSLFQTMMVQAQEEGEDIEDPQLSGPTEPVIDDTESVPTHSNDPLLSGEDRLKLNELMELCTNLSQRVLDLENTKTSQAAEITELKERVKKLERMNKLRTSGLKRLRKVGRSARIESSEDEDLGDQEDASKQGRKINEINEDTKVTLVDETQGRYGDNLMFDTNTSVLDDEKVFTGQDVVKKEISIAEPVTTLGEVVTTANVVVSTAEVTTASATTTTVDELTLAQTLIEIKAAKLKAVTTAATTTTIDVTRPKSRGVVVQEPKIAQRLQEELQAELEEEERMARQKEEDANIAKWDNVQAIIEADYELAARLQAQEQEELTIEERSKMFVELMDKRNKHFARLRVEEQRR
ncbi:putative ribonuclease H-like domain-containing protein [Tanacetum coccineum]|uniref:Ribonuclease H-like domain-containing protein n=1 Tax=Tanacetum coccineum TaxID=301880 RepID=A0ABQ4Z0L7_9ASTR